MVVNHFINSYLPGILIKFVSMKTKIYFQILPSILLAAFITSGSFFINHVEKKNEKGEIENEKSSPELAYDNFLLSRTYPNAAFDVKGFEQAMQQISAQRKSKSLHNYNWTLEGPNNIGGRFNCVVVDPVDTNIIYAGAAQGGIFKTINAGATWQPIFDNHSQLSIGHIKIDPFNRNKIWVGTGDVNISGNVFLGDGIYQSTDGGSTWNNKGLSQTKVIAQIDIDPTDSNTIFAATMGNPFAKDSSRGMYKSTDGGTTWDHSLYINDSTGVISFVIDPNNHNNIFASAFTRLRTYDRSLVYSNDCRIYRTTDGGTTWQMLTNGLPTGVLSRINLAIHSGNGNSIVYACVVDTSFNVQGVYKTNDNGNTWIPKNINNLNPIAGNGQGWYYCNIFIDPKDTFHLYICGLELVESLDGGHNWQYASPQWWTYQVHADKHWMCFDKYNRCLLATDGGLYKLDSINSFTRSWRDIENIPASQFYHVVFNPNDKTPNPQYYGGLQDNGTVSGNTSSINFWNRYYGGDGFQPAFMKSNPMVQYAEVQYGALNYSDDGGMNWFPETNGLNLDDSVKPWDMRYIVSTINDSKLYCGTDRVYKLTGAPYGFWNDISGKITKPYYNGKRNNYITALAESPLDSGTLLVGTGDGNLWRCVHETNWQLINNTLPNRYYTAVNFSYLSKKRYFATQQGYRYNDFTAHIYRSDDSAQTWNSIQGDMPNIGINDLYVIKQNDSFMLVATDGGIFATANAGNHWENITGNIPLCPVMDIEIDTFHHKIIAGTYARSMWSLSIDSVFDHIRNLLIVDTTSHVDTTHHVGINNLQQLTQPIIYPTITQNKFNVVSPKNIDFISIYNQHGELIKQKKVGDIKTEETLDGFSSGIYFVVIHFISHQQFTQKIIKE